MNPGNRSTVTEFIMVGLTPDSDLKLLLFILLLPVYIFTLLSNFSLLVIVWFSTNLHTPMYFFLSQLSFLDITLSSNISPNMLVHLLTEKKTISFVGCMVQNVLFCGSVSTEFFLVAVMAFDRYVAICNPLQYTRNMTKHLCVCLVAGSYAGGYLNSLILSACLYRIDFCGPNILDSFTCDFPVILETACNDYKINELVRFVCTSIVVLSSFIVVFVSYFYIIRTIARMHTKEGRVRAASTCFSHFTCVFLFYSSILFMEITPNSNHSEPMFKVLCVVLSVLCPALNPIIYSLRNKEVKEGLKKILQKATKCQ